MLLLSGFTAGPYGKEIPSIKNLCGSYNRRGNWEFLDRVRLNYVVDFLYFKLIDFPIFNVADIYVTVSAFAFFVLLAFYYKEKDFEQIFSGGKRRGNAD